MEFRRMTEDERAKLGLALRENADSGKPLLMDARDTRFLDSGDPHDEEVISAIKSIPCHYRAA